MSGIFNIGLSALHAAQQGLNTTGHNIANVHTEGYSRQRVELETRPPQLLGNGYVGQGVNLDNIRRIADDFLVGELRNAIGNEAGANKLTELLNIVDQQVGDARINDRMQGFFESINDANDDPRLMATRQVMLENARSMLARFSEQEQELNRLARNTDQQIATKVQEINALTQAIADINEQISRGAGLARGVPANDLLDQRDQLVATLSTKVAVQVQPRDDNTINVLIGDSQLVVAGAVQAGLTTSANALDASRLEIAFDAGGGANQVTAAINGGEIGALLDFRDGTLEPTRNAIGRLAASLAMTVNARHREGMDLSGNLGGDLFSVPAPQFTSLATNAGSISLAFDETSVGDLTTSDYRMTYDGSDFILTRLTDGSTQTLSGAGPFDVDGMTITLTSAPAVGDEYLLQPTKFVPRGLALAVSDPAELALALPVRTAAELGNTSDATICG
ncbi:MAG: flagellar hook-associated protein FlgK, partial [Gammaproteobacteria bacterium]